jgi:hypothetical protein
MLLMRAACALEVIDMKVALFAILAAVVCVGVGASAQGQITLNLVPASSSLTAGGTASGLPLTAQGTGANVTSYSGTVVITDPRGGSFSFVSANGIAANSGNWQPLPGGTLPGSAPANYGLRQSLLGAVAALRNGRFGLTSGTLTLSGSGGNGTFPVSQVTGTALQGDDDYNAGALGTGTSSIAGLMSAAGPSGSNGNIVISGLNITLTLPVNMSFSQTVSGITIVVTLTGQLVATGTLPALTGACCRGTTCATTTAASCPSQANQVFAGVGTVCNAAGNNTTPCCKADFNHSGVPVTVQDIFDFLAAYFGNDPLADINGAGGVSVQDIFDFLAAYFAGC